MKSAANAMLALLSATALSGCIAAAAIPLGAAGLIGREQITKSSDRPDASIAPPEQRIDAIPKQGVTRAKANATSLPNIRVVDVAPAVEPASATAVIPIARRSLAAKGSYGDSYDGLTRYLFAKSQARERGAAVQSVVLFPNTQVEHPDFTICADMPLAMVVDLGNADVQAIARSEPDLIEAVTTARLAGVTVNFTSERPPADAAQVAAALEAAGLGPVRHERDLWMTGDLGSTGKDSLRWKIASTQCIIALLGHRPSDFSQIYDDPATASGSPALDALRGDGWFLYPDSAQEPGQ